MAVIPAIVRRMRHGRRISALWGLLFTAAGLTGPAPAVDLAPGYEATTLASGITGGTCLTAAPDGRIFIGEQTGTVRVWKNGLLLPAPVLKLDVDSWWERGLLGMTLDPDFPRQPYLYVHWTAAKPHTHFRLSRFTVTGDEADPSSEKVLLQGEDQAKDPGASFPGGHQGGGVTFGPGNRLYLASGEHTTMLPSQKLESLLGKILVVERDGRIPPDGPFAARTQGSARAIYAYGLRNPWALAYDAKSNLLYANDVGASAYEEVNEIVAGANYGWPEAEGPVQMPEKFRDPVFYYGHQQGLSLGGGCFYRAPAGATHPFPPTFEGRYFVQEFMAGWMAVFDPAKPRESSALFAKNLQKPAAVAVTSEGDLVVLERNTWVKDKDFKEGLGRLTRIRYTGASAAPAPPATPATPPWAETWSALESLREGGFLSYQLRQEPWTPGYSQSRAIRLPAGQKLRIDAASGSFLLPPGTVLVSHLLALGKKWQSNIIVVGATGVNRGAAYRWNEAGTDATLVREPATAQTDNGPWIFPAPSEAIPIPGYAPGFPVDLTPANLANGPLDAVIDGAAAKKTVALTDETAPLEDRVRSFLDVNCAACHRPGGIGRGFYDARLSTPLGSQQLIGGPLMSGNLGIDGAKAVIPGDPERSMLWIRLRRPPGDPMRMPPACASRETPPVLPLLERWIKGLAKAG